MNIYNDLSTFKKIEVNSEDSNLELMQSQELIKIFQKLGKSLQKTNQTVTFSFEEINKKLADNEILVNSLRDQKNDLSTQNNALISFLVDLIDLISNFVKVSNKSDNTEIRAIAETMRKSLEASMQKTGFQIIPAINEIPDTQYHYILDQRDIDDPELKNKIIEIIKEGISFQGKVIRKAEVITGK